MLDLELCQKQVAEQIGVSQATIWNWECHESSPQARDIPAIIRFLGYDPFPSPQSLAERLVTSRKVIGVTQKEMAKRLRLDPATLARWEQDKSRRPLPETVWKVSLIPQNVDRTTHDIWS
jgi:transcriptional regulator with XRE-family HTH domain